MSNETNNPNLSPAVALLSELPVEVSPERVQEVGAYFTQILETYGVKTEVSRWGKFGTSMWPARRAEFISGDQCFKVEKLDYKYEPGFSPLLEAGIYERSGGKKSEWKLQDMFSYNENKKGALTYRRGKSNPPPKPGIEDVVTTLESFLTTSSAIIEGSKRPFERVKALGRQGLNNFFHATPN